MITALAGTALVVATAARVRTHFRPRRFSHPRVRRRKHRQSPTAEQWAALLDTMAAEVRTGRSLSVALCVAVDAASPLGATVVQGCTLPLGVSTVLQPDEAVVVHAINATYALGGPSAATLDSAAALLRERIALRAEALAHAAQARLSARVLTTVPLLFTAWNGASSASFRAGLLHPVGTASACVGGALNCAGWWWMRRIVNGCAS